MDILSNAPVTVSFKGGVVSQKRQAINYTRSATSLFYLGYQLFNLNSLGQLATKFQEKTPNSSSEALLKLSCKLTKKSLPSRSKGS
jgi:hypothetical protein